MSAAAAAAATLQASRVSSGAEACSRTSGAACWGRRPTGWQQEQGRPRGGAHRLKAAQTHGRGASRRPLVARGAAEPAKAPPQAAAGALVPDRQGYRSFLLEGCEFLIAETADGKLNLQDSFVTTDISSSSGHDEDEERPAPSYRRPEGLAQVANGQQEYQAVPWYSQYQGDIIRDKPVKQWVWRYYLVPVASREPYLRLDLDQPLYVLDGKAATLSLAEVHRLAPPDTPAEELRLRIRDDVVTVDTADSLPTWEHAVQARIGGAPALSKLEMARLEEYLSALEAAHNQGSLDDVEFETARDVHWLAGMQAGGAGVAALGGAFEAAVEAAVGDDGLPIEPEEDVMGGWEAEMFEDLMPQYDDEADETEYEDFDSPAADY